MRDPTYVVVVLALMISGVALVLYRQGALGLRSVLAALAATMLVAGFILATL
jgi:hypothetical protein